MKKPRSVILRGEHRNEVLAWALAPKVYDKLRKRGYEVHLEEYPFDKTRFKRNLSNKPLVNLDDALQETDEVIEDINRKYGSDNLLIFNFHNYDFRDRKNSFGMRAEDLRIGDRAYLGFKDQKGMTEIYSELMRNNEYVIEIPTPTKPMPPKIKGRFSRNLGRFGQKLSWYEENVADMAEAKRRRLDGKLIVDKICDLIEVIPSWNKEMQDYELALQTQEAEHD